MKAHRLEEAAEGTFIPEHRHIKQSQQMTTDTCLYNLYKFYCTITCEKRSSSGLIRAIKL
jgi:hypothetical protein